MDNKETNLEINEQINLELSKEDIDSMNFSDLTPESISPNFHSVRSKDYVPYVTEDGKQYPDMLIDMYNSSALHGAILRSKIDQVSGEGFVWDTSIEGSDLLTAWAGNCNMHDEDLNEVLWKVSTDFELFNGFALLINWSKTWDKIISLEHIDFSKIRAEKVNQDGIVEGYWYSWKWEKQRSGKVYIPTFNMASAAENKKAYKKAIEKGTNEELQAIFLKPTTQIIYYKPYHPDSFYYPLPEYNGALAAIQTDILSDGYGLNSFQNGLSADIVVTMFNLMTPEKKRQAAKKFDYMYTGSRGGKKIVYHFANKVEEALKIDKIGNNKEDGIYTSVNENTLQKILSGHRITTPELVGIKAAGQLGSGNDAQLINFWQNTVIIPEQNEITKIFNKIMDINQFPIISIKQTQLLTEEDAAEIEDINSEVNDEDNNENKIKE